MPLANPLHSPAGIFSGCRGKGPTRLDFGKAGIGNQSLDQVEGATSSVPVFFSFSTALPIYRSSLVVFLKTEQQDADHVLNLHGGFG
jgi:hypothetical protein